MNYLVNIIQGDIQYFLWLLVVGVISAILTGRVKVIIKITAKKIEFIISILKKLFIHKNVLIIDEHMYIQRRPTPSLF